ncbi:hypothetical protein HGRIS_004497 [Hohenbuehelia grisea]|uniref:Uncharacterized protein n=1 Tax=Hohenbuehelia grisea TaxID=104357 RepID=A0ABR3JC76_9AGAR
MRLLEPFVCSLGDNNDELRTIWQTRRCSLTKTAYLSSRFGGLALAIFGAFPSISPPMTITINGLAFFVCVVSNGLFAIRVWALWLQSHRINHSINYSSGTNDIFPTAGSTSPLPTRHDHWPEASLLFIAPFIACIVHNIVIIFLTFVVILRWKRDVPKGIRSPAVNVIWIDSVIYASLMLGKPLSS